MSNPLLANIKLPGRSFQLPSKGIFYKNGELDDSITDGIIHVRALSAIDEITLKNPDLLLSGEAVDVFKNSIDGLNKPRELLTKDVDAITFFLRTVSYGPYYEIDVQKHNCEKAKNDTAHNSQTNTINIDDHIAKMKIMDEKTLDELFLIKLPNGQNVTLQPYIYKDMISIINKIALKKEKLSPEDEKSSLMDTVCFSIQSVDGISDKQMIREWATTLSTKTINSILNQVAKANSTWGIDMNIDVACKYCGENMEVALPINPVSFFTE